MKKKRKELDKCILETEEDILFIGGDINARIGDKGERYESVKWEQSIRKSNDSKINQ